jgi:hypothetical protein
MIVTMRQFWLADLAEKTVLGSRLRHEASMRTLPLLPEARAVGSLCEGHMNAYANMLVDEEAVRLWRGFEGSFPSADSSWVTDWLVVRDEQFEDAISGKRNMRGTTKHILRKAWTRKFMEFLLNKHMFHMACLEIDRVKRDNGNNDMAWATVSEH